MTTASAFHIDLLIRYRVPVPRPQTAESGTYPLVVTILKLAVIMLLSGDGVA